MCPFVPLDAERIQAKLAGSHVPAARMVLQPPRGQGFAGQHRDDLEAFHGGEEIGQQDLWLLNEINDPVYNRQVTNVGYYWAPNDYLELGTSSEALGHLGYMDMLGRFFVNDQRTSTHRALAFKNGHRVRGDNGYRFKLGYKYSRYFAVEGEFSDVSRPHDAFANPASLASSFRSTGFGIDTVDVAKWGDETDERIVGNEVTSGNEEGGLKAGVDFHLAFSPEQDAPHPGVGGRGDPGRAGEVEGAAHRRHLGRARHHRSWSGPFGRGPRG